MASSSSHTDEPHNDTVNGGSNGAAHDSGEAICSLDCSDNLHCLPNTSKGKKQKSPLTKIVEKFGDLTARDHSHSHKHKSIKVDKKEAADESDGNCLATKEKGSTSPLGLHEKHVYLIQRGDKEKMLMELPKNVAQKSAHLIYNLKDLSEAHNEVYATFLQHHCTDDLVPVSSKMLVFDAELGVKKAFYALVYNNVRAALVWDTEKQEYDGMITISDFIYILVKHYKSPLIKMEEIENHTIRSWKEDIGQDRLPLVYATEDTSVVDALKLLTRHKIHRLPVFDSAFRDPMHILSHKRIMKFLYLHMANIPRAEFMEKTLEDLGIGTYDNVVTVTEDTPVYEALSQLMSKKISALPVMNNQGKCINLYAKFDAMHLAAQKSYSNLDIPVKKALEMRYEGCPDKVRMKPQVHSCFIDDCLMDVIHKFMSTDVHRLTVHNRGDGNFIGIVSLSDILNHIILKQI